MRKEKIVEIDGKKITVREIKASDAIEILSTREGGQLLIGITSGNAKDIHTILLKCIDKTPEEFEQLAEGYSAYAKIEEAFKEVNPNFLALLPARLKQMTESMKTIAAAMPAAVGPSSTARAGLLKKVTTMSGNTAGPGSKES